jgi:hypothetical protein
MMQNFIKIFCPFLHVNENKHIGAHADVNAKLLLSGPEIHIVLRDVGGNKIALAVISIKCFTYGTR